MAAEVQTEFPTLRTLVLPDPVDLELFTPGDRAEARRSLGLDPERRYVLFTSVHRNNPLKRLELAEAAVAVARRKHPDIEFLIASGYAHDSMPTLFRASNVSLCTSVSEGWPNCIKESLACGIGFVSTDVSDLRAIALVDDTCKITEATPEALGMALNDALEEQSGMDKRRHVEAMSMPNFARLLVAEYEQLLSGTWRASG
jgi:glycosyltransferase involved in cell wall biosynthesis